MEPISKSTSSKAILFAGILLGGYIALLMGLVYVGQQHLRQSLFDQAHLALSKQAAAVGYFLAEQRDEINELTKNPALNNFLANRALGMSMKYGLRTSLLSVRDELKRLMGRKLLQGNPVYSRIDFYDRKGKFLTSTDTGESAAVDLEQGVPAGLQPIALQLFKAEDGYRARFYATVAHHEELAGMIVAEMNLADLLTPLLRQSTNGGIANKVKLLGPADELLLMTNPLAAGEHWDDQEGTIVLPVADSGFTLVGKVTLSHGLDLLTSSWFLVALSLITIPVLGGVYHLLKLNNKHLLLEARYLASRKQQKELHRFRERLDLSTDLIAVIDPDSSAFLDVNQTLCDFFGLGREVLLQRRFIEFSERYRSLSQWRELVAHLRAHGRVSSEDSGRRQNGQPFYLEINAHYSADEERDTIVAIFRDSSERKQAELSLQQANQRFTAVLDGIDAAVYVADMETYELLYVNPTIKELFGNVVGKKCWQVLQADQTGPCPFCTNDKLLDAHGMPKESYTWEVQNTRTGLWFHCADRAIPWDDGRYVRLEVATDISTRIQDEKALKAAHQQLESLAYYDPLTKLANRRLFTDRLLQAFSRADRTHTKLAVCYLDLDGFKEINDFLGHEQGDNLLMQVSERLQTTLRGEDTVARWGGDEFALLISGQVSEDECANTLDRLLEKLATPYTIQGHIFDVTASIGVTIYPQDRGDPDTLLRHADQAMYLAKQRGRNRYYFFDPDQDRRVHAHREQILRVATAIKLDELRLYFQPKVDMSQGRVVGAETLVRWQNPEQGLLAPSAFLPYIEGHELQIELDWWVIRNAIMLVADWCRQGLELTVSINVSPITLQKPGFARVLNEQLDKTGVDGRLIELEILESGSIDNLEAIASVIIACSAFGVTFALDDYGTGYSSLTFIRRLPVQTLKIDQSFVRDMLKDHDDLNIVEGVIGLAKAFEREVIAEGVESEEIGIRLMELGCCHAQGYFISKPMPPDVLLDWCREYRSPEVWLETACRLSAPA